MTWHVRASRSASVAAVRDLTQIIKAYDVRGVYPDQLDAELAERVGAAFARVVGASRSAGGPGAVVVGRDMRPSGPSSSPPSAPGSPGRASTSSTSGWPAPTSSTSPPAVWTCPAPCSPRATTRPSTTGSRCAAPGPRPSVRTPGLAQIRDMVAEPVPASGDPVGTITHRDMLADYAAFLHELVDLSAIRPLKVVVDAGNGMAGHTAPAVLDVAGPGRRAPCTSSSTAPSPTTRPTRSSRRTCATCRRRSSPRAPTSGWPSTATPTAASSSTSAASWSRRPRSPALIAARELAKHPGCVDHPQPDHLARRCPR